MDAEKEVVIVENREQAEEYLRDKVSCRSILLLHYNDRGLFADSAAYDFIPLNDYFGVMAHEYTAAKTYEKLSVIPPQNYLQRNERYFHRFYYNYFYALEYIVKDLKKKNRCDSFVIFNTPVRVGEFVINSPLSKILDEQNYRYRVIASSQRGRRLLPANKLMGFVKCAVNKMVTRYAGGKRHILFSSPAYNLLSAIQKETDDLCVEILCVARYSLRHAAYQIYLLLVSVLGIRRSGLTTGDLRLYIEVAEPSSLDHFEVIEEHIRSILARRDEIARICRMLKPRYFISQMQTLFYDIVNEALHMPDIRCRTIYVPHGANFLPPDKRSKYEEDAIYEINGMNDFDYLVVQSRLYDDYIKMKDVKSRLIYGNKIWGDVAGRNGRLIKRHISGGKKTINILYASSSMSFGSLRLGVWLLEEEMLRDMMLLVKAIQGTEINIGLKLRNTVTGALVKEVLKGYSNYVIIDEPFSFARHMARYQALVTYRSTVIEDALHMRKPVIIFDHDGKYKAVYDDNSTIFYLDGNRIGEFPDVVRRAVAASEKDFSKYLVHNEPLFQ